MDRVEFKEGQALDADCQNGNCRRTYTAPAGRRRSVLNTRLPLAQDEIDERGDTRPSLIVIGGGFAGTACCRMMHKEFKVTLIDAKEYFEYYPGICRAYADPHEHRKLSRHYQPICDDLGVDFCWGEVTSVNHEKKQITVKPISETEEMVLYFNYLILANGSQYGINLTHTKLSVSKGSECLWYPTFLEKTIKDSSWSHLDERFLGGRRKHIEAEYKALVELNRQGATILVVGAGFVGIEFATEVQHFFTNIKVVIAESRDACIGVMPPKCIKYCQDYLDRNGIKCIYNAVYKQFLSADNSMDAEITDPQLNELAKEWGIDEPSRVYMAVGLRPINKFMPPECLTPGGRGGWIRVNRNQEVLIGDQPLPHVFAAGNCCTYDDGGPQFPKNAFPGEDMAGVACHNIRVRQAMRDPNFGGCFCGCFKPKKKKEVHWSRHGTGSCATSLGPNDATLVIGSTPDKNSGYTLMTGFLAALSKEFVRWSKIDQVSNGCIGGLVWKLAH